MAFSRIYRRYGKTQAEPKNNPTFQNALKFFAAGLQRLCIGPYTPAFRDRPVEWLRIFDDFVPRMAHGGSDVVRQHALILTSAALSRGWTRMNADKTEGSFALSRFHRRSSAFIRVQAFWFARAVHLISETLKDCSTCPLRYGEYCRHLARKHLRSVSWIAVFHSEWIQRGYFRQLPFQGVSRGLTQMNADKEQKCSSDASQPTAGSGSQSPLDTGHPRQINGGPLRNLHLPLSATAPPMPAGLPQAAS